MPNSVTTARNPVRTPIREPGEPSDDLAVRPGLEQPGRQQRFHADLDRIRDAELRAERETEGIRLH